MKQFRKWNRILHRDIGFFFIGTSIIYGLSGIALNHLRDWNPNYRVTRETVSTGISLKKSPVIKENILNFLDEINARRDYKSHYYPEPRYLKIFLEGGSSVVMNVETGQGAAEYLKKRPVFYHVNYLHYNPNNWWKWFSDIFSGALIFLALSSIFMVRGKKGAWGRGGVYIALGIVIPLLLLFLF
jgi:hypothetical protein